MKNKIVDCASLGIRTTEDMAKRLDLLVKDLPQEQRRVKRVTKAVQVDFEPGERADISFITTEETDREHEKVLASGFDLADYLKNPIVLFNHDYEKIVGRCLWIKNKGMGLIAKTQYASRPSNLPEAVEWFPDTIYSLTQQKVLVGKSVGYLPLSMRHPTEQERAEDKSLEIVCERALLLEYSCVSVPCNASALVEAVNKGMRTPFAIEQVTRTKAPKKPEKPLDLSLITFNTQEIVAEALRKFRGRI